MADVTTKSNDSDAAELAAELAAETEAKADVIATATAHRDQVTDLTTALLLSRFDAQDTMLAGIQRDVRRTNGRVTALEKKDAERIAVGNRVVAQNEVRHWRIQVWVPTIAVFVGGFGGYAGHALGLW